MGPAPILCWAFERDAKRSRSAFTLVELMIVVGIVGMLAAMAIPAFAHARETARNARFAADLRVACDAFIEYAADTGRYPPDTTPGIMPNGMADYLRRVHWYETTAVGGQWDWDNGQFSVKAGVSVYEPTASQEQLERLDAMIDDGSLSSGSFRARSSGYISIIE
jgi:prepilin-type N-terminal cleavage/methylation domain-containing protein